MLSLVISTAAWFFLQSAIPDSAESRWCRDDNGVDRCSESQQRRMRERFGVGSIEDHLAAGDTVRRVFFVDGYGRDLVLVAFVRPRGRDPVVSVHYPHADDGARPAFQQAPVPQQIWDDIISRSENFDRRFVLRPGEDPETVGLCMHAWVYTIEAADQRQHGFPRPVVRRKIENACEDGPGSSYAYEVERTALSLIPHCAAIDPTQHRRPASILDACRILAGDRLAAAEVLNRALVFRQIEGPIDEPKLRGIFDHRARIDWNGSSNSGDGSAAAFWTAQLAQPSGVTNFYYETIEGETADRVRLRGRLSHSVDTPRGRSTGYETARVDQIWVRDQGGDFRIESAVVGSWERVNQR